jgi:hypothetical protein
MASGSKRGAVEVVLRWYVNKVVHYAVHHHSLGQVLDQTDSAKYLGLNIHKSLSWDSHIDKITKKANSTLAFLGRNVSRCPTTIKACALYHLSTTYPRICIQHM